MAQQLKVEGEYPHLKGQRKAHRFISRGSENLALTGVGLACAATTSVAFFLHFLGWLRMPFTINFIGIPSIILMLLIGLYSWNRALPFWIRLSAGIVAGACGLLVYDVTRYAIYRFYLVDYDPFHAIPMLGSLITDEPATTRLSFIAGWLYHFWNGFGFAIIYALMAGSASWKWALVWAMFLEIGVLLSYPSLLAIQATVPFVAVSLIGHGGYGLAVGLTVNRLTRKGELK